jgi:hypothetical protein
MNMYAYAKCERKKNNTAWSTNKSKKDPNPWDNNILPVDVNVYEPSAVKSNFTDISIFDPTTASPEKNGSMQELNNTLAGSVDETKSKVQSVQIQPDTAPNLTGIPDDMKTNFEHRSGFSFNDVRVFYNSDDPARIGALAYTQGNQVHIGPGQEKYLPHELGHVVQQKQGIVRPTHHVNGLAINNDTVLEKKADLMDDKKSVIKIDDQNILGVIQKTGVIQMGPNRATPIIRGTVNMTQYPNYEPAAGQGIECGLIKGTFNRNNVTDLHVAPGANLLNDMPPTLRFLDRHLPITAVLNLRPGGGAIVKVVVDVLGRALGSLLPPALQHYLTEANRLKSQRPRDIVTQAAIRASGNIHALVRPEHRAYLEVIDAYIMQNAGAGVEVGFPGFTGVKPSLGVAVNQLGGDSYKSYRDDTYAVARLGVGADPADKLAAVITEYFDKPEPILDIYIPRTLIGVMLTALG